MNTTLKIKYAAEDILWHNPNIVNIVYKNEETGNLFGLAYNMQEKDDRNAIETLMKVMHVKNITEVVNRTVTVAA